MSSIGKFIAQSPKANAISNKNYCCSLSTFSLIVCVCCVKIKKY